MLATLSASLLHNYESKNYPILINSHYCRLCHYFRLHYFEAEQQLDDDKRFGADG